MKASEFFGRTSLTAKSLVKIVLQSHASDTVSRARGGRLVVMGNGPSLADTIAESSAVLKATDTMSVNFAPLTAEFFTIRPRYHILADPIFFATEPQRRVTDMCAALERVDWPLTLFVPSRGVRRIPAAVMANTNISTARFNFVGVGGYEWFENAAYNRGWGMPRPRNVLIPALMCGIRAGYEQIDIVGAAHTWTRTLTVGNDNRVYSVQPHYYDKDKHTDVAPFAGHIDDILESFMIAFRSYHTLRRYADHVGVSIYNATPGSFIDAFERRELT